MTVCDVSVVIPTYQRVDDLRLALAKIEQCEPQPQEIVVHIDFGDKVTEPFLHSVQEKYQNIKIISSDHRVGPGGGRNKAIAVAKNNIVASFDDDSYPIDKDYFSRLLKIFTAFPDVAVVGAAIYHQNETIEDDQFEIYQEHSFIGCGCAYRKDIFLEMQGYVELPVAYGMEEVDLSLRLYNAQWKVLISPWLRVFHDTSLTHHTKPKITAASISNQILLTYLRYPICLWWIGFGQTLSRIIWLVKHRRFAGIFSGIINIPILIASNYQHRSVVKSDSLKSFLYLKRNPIVETFERKEA
ncbi:MAG: glycosyltransferase [Limnothrix sp. RL_2_0]|nr:glycosyltransferase [Limnothrix sp. RL_2_0]